MDFILEVTKNVKKFFKDFWNIHDQDPIKLEGSSRG